MEKDQRIEAIKTLDEFLSKAVFEYKWKQKNQEKIAAMMKVAKDLVEDLSK